MRKRKWPTVAVATVLFVSLAVYVSQAAFSDDSSGSSSGPSPKATTTPTTIAAQQDHRVVDDRIRRSGCRSRRSTLAAITLGTGKASTTPKIGYLDRCGGVPSGGPPVFELAVGEHDCRHVERQAEGRGDKAT